MRSNFAHRLFFIFQLENILRSNLNFSTSYGRFTDLKSLSLMKHPTYQGYYKFYMAWRKKFTKKFTCY